MYLLRIVFRLMARFIDFRVEIRSNYILPNSHFEMIKNRLLVVEFASQHIMTCTSELHSPNFQF